MKKAFVVSLVCLGLAGCGDGSGGGGSNPSPSADQGGGSNDGTASLAVNLRKDGCIPAGARAFIHDVRGELVEEIQLGEDGSIDLGQAPRDGYFGFLETADISGQTSQVLKHIAISLLKDGATIEMVNFDGELVNCDASADEDGDSFRVQVTNPGDFDSLSFLPFTAIQSTDTANAAADFLLDVAPAVVVVGRNDQNEAQRYGFVDDLPDSAGTTINLEVNQNFASRSWMADRELTNLDVSWVSGGQRYLLQDNGFEPTNSGSFRTLQEPGDAHLITEYTNGVNSVFQVKRVANEVASVTLGEPDPASLQTPALIGRDLDYELVNANQNRATLYARFSGGLEQGIMAAPQDTGFSLPEIPADLKQSSETVDFLVLSVIDEGSTPEVINLFESQVLPPEQTRAELGNELFDSTLDSRVTFTTTNITVQ